MNKQNRISIGIGLSTLLMIFTVLILTIFATLSYLQAKRNLNETDKIIESSVEYYDADYKASEIYNYLKENANDESYMQEKDISFSNNEYHYSVKINDKKYLDVVLTRHKDELVITKWQEVVLVDGDYEYKGFVH